MLDHVGQTFAQQIEILFRVLRRERLASYYFRSAAVHLEGADGGDEHHDLRGQA